MIGFENKKAKLYFGDSPVKAAYLGSTKVYPSTPALVVSPVTFEFAAAGGSVAMTIECDVDIDWEINNIGGTSHFQFSFSGTQGRQTIGRAAPRLLTGTGPGTITITAPNNTSTSAIFENDLYIRASGSTDEIYLSLTQAAGEKVYGAWKNTSIAVGQTSFPASGGTTSFIVNVAREWTWNEVAGSGGTETSQSTPNTVRTTDPVATVNDPAHTLTVTSLGTTEKAATSITLTARSEHAQNDVSVVITQAANTWYDAELKLEGDSTSIGATGGSLTFTSYVRRMYSSGEYGAWGAGYGSLSGTAEGFSVSGTTVTAENRGTTVGNARSITVVSVYAGLTSNAITITQAANYIVELAQSTGSMYYPTVAYTGGTSTPQTTYTGTWHYRCSSGAAAAGDIPAGYGSETIHNTWTGGGNGATLNGGTGSVYWPSNAGTARSCSVTRTVYNVLTPNTANYPGAPTVISPTGTFTASCSQKANPSTITRTVRIGPQSSAGVNVVRDMISPGIELMYNSSTPVSSSAGSILMGALRIQVGETIDLTWKGDYPYFRLYSATPTRLMKPYIQAGEGGGGQILSGAGGFSNGVPIEIQGRVDAGSIFEIGIFGYDGASPYSLEGQNDIPGVEKLPEQTITKHKES